MAPGALFVLITFIVLFPPYRLITSFVPASAFCFDRLLPSYCPAAF
jgi:hypothetical protein